MPEKTQPNWVYLQGHVKIDNTPHYILLKELADELGVDPTLRAQIGSAWAANMQTPVGVGADVARGHVNPHGRCVIWESTVDRNHVRDSVEGRPVI